MRQSNRVREGNGKISQERWTVSGKDKPGWGPKISEETKTEKLAEESKRDQGIRRWCI